MLGLLSSCGWHCLRFARGGVEGAEALAVLPFVALDVEVPALAGNPLELGELAERGKWAIFALLH